MKKKAEDYKSYSTPPVVNYHVAVYSRGATRWFGFSIRYAVKLPSMATLEYVPSTWILFICLLSGALLYSTTRDISS